MKIFYIECTEDELKANRGIMDAVVDAFQGVINTFYGSYAPVSDEQDEDAEESETES